MPKQDIHHSRIELGPLVAAKLEHRLAAVIDAVVVTFFAVNHLVVLVKGMPQDPIACFFLQFRFRARRLMTATEFRCRPSRESYGFQEECGSR